MISEPLHWVCGDHAAQVLMNAIPASNNVRIGRDDLAIGPLTDIDARSPQQRIHFWQTLAPVNAGIAWPTAMQGEYDLVNQALAEQHDVLVWVGDSASEWLWLARLAAVWTSSERDLWMVEAPTAVGLCTTKQLQQALLQAKKLTADQIQTWAAIWRDLALRQAPVRLWRDGQFYASDFQALDEQLLKQDGPVPLTALREAVRGFYPTDWLAAWRWRVLSGEQSDSSSV